MLLADLAATSLAVAATSKRLEKTALLADRLREAAPDEIAVVASYLAGELRQRRTGVGWRSLSGLPAPAEVPELSVLEVDAAFQALSELSGPGSGTARGTMLATLWSRATAAEQRLLAGLVSGELRQGASAGVLTDAVARASGAPLAAVRRAYTLCGSLPDVAVAALTGGSLEDFRLVVGRGLAPMLAGSAPSLAEALAAMPLPVAVDWKLDGVRVQAHRTGTEVRLLSRSLDDLTGRMPEIVAAVAALPVSSVVLDGEALVVTPDGRPVPFQETASRALSAGGVGLTPWWFDVLHVDGRDLLDEPLSTRAAVLADLVPASQRAPRLLTASPEDAAAFQLDALAHGHEGVVVKAVDAPYESGRRGGAWLKVKPRHTLDLVVLAVEHGSGRRRGWLSNLHLGARQGDGFVMLGKTFKGLTDETLRWQTERFRALQVSDDGRVVTVRPEQVVEIAFDGVQTSTRYPGGVALRFARVVRYREDKTAAEADTLDDVLRLRS